MGSLIKKEDKTKSTWGSKKNVSNSAGGWSTVKKEDKTKSTLGSTNNVSNSSRG